MKINGTYKFRTQAITGRLRLLFRYQSIIPVLIDGSFQPAFVDEMFVELGVTNTYKEIFKNSYAVENYASFDCFFVRSAVYHKSVNGGWILGFVADSYDGTPGSLVRSRRLETMKLNTFIGFTSEQNITKRYPEVSSNDIETGWLLNSSDYSLWASAFLTDTFPPPMAIKQDTSVKYFGGGIWGRDDRSSLKVSSFPFFERCVTSAYFTEENEYLLNTIKSSQFLSSDLPFTTETFLHPLFDVKRDWTLPGFRCTPWLFSEDRKELIYIRTYVELVSDSYYLPSIKEIYYAKFADDGTILEDVLIVDLKYYDDLPSGHPEKLEYNDLVPEIPFWRVNNLSGYISLFDKGKVSLVSRFKSGKIEWVDTEDLDSNILGGSLTPEIIEELLSKDSFEVKIAKWDGSKFVQEDNKKYSVSPTKQEDIDFFKTNNIFNPNKYITFFSLFSIAFY
jgi:hypothetical protein